MEQDPEGAPTHSTIGVFDFICNNNTLSLSIFYRITKLVHFG